MNPLNVLIVDDEDLILKELKDFLDQLPEIASVACARNGLDALAAIHASDSHPDVVISDIRMPSLDGIALLKRIKAIAPSIEVILITGYQTKATADEAVGLGASEVIAKPFNLAKMRAALGKVGCKKEARRESTPKEATQ